MLLDTHTLLWLFMGDLRLGAATRDAVERRRKQDPIYVPPIAFWEIGMNVAKRRFALGRPLRDWTASVLNVSNMLVAPFNETIAIDAAELADGLHGDPADRIIIATARAVSCVLVTADQRILDYAERGHLQAIDARC